MRICYLFVVKEIKAGILLLCLILQTTEISATSFLEALSQSRPNGIHRIVLYASNKYLGDNLVTIYPHFAELERLSNEHFEVLCFVHPRFPFKGNGKVKFQNIPERDKGESEENYEVRIRRFISENLTPRLDSQTLLITYTESEIDLYTGRVAGKDQSLLKEVGSQKNTFYLDLLNIKNCDPKTQELLSPPLKTGIGVDVYTKSQKIRSWIYHSMDSHLSQALIPDDHFLDLPPENDNFQAKHQLKSGQFILINLNTSSQFDDPIAASAFLESLAKMVKGERPLVVIHPKNLKESDAQNLVCDIQAKFGTQLVFLPADAYKEHAHALRKAPHVITHDTGFAHFAFLVRNVFRNPSELKKIIVFSWFNPMLDTWMPSGYPIFSKIGFNGPTVDPQQQIAFWTHLSINLGFALDPKTITDLIPSYSNHTSSGNYIIGIRDLTEKINDSKDSDHARSLIRDPKYGYYDFILRLPKKVWSYEYWELIKKEYFLLINALKIKGLTEEAFYILNLNKEALTQSYVPSDTCITHLEDFHAKN